MRYDSDREYWEKWFPAQWISESFPGQFRNWFYAILAMSTVMENRAPFELMFGYRLMKDEHGEEMHKSKGNSIEFNEAAEREGADAMRWLYAAHNPEQDLWFGYAKIHEARRQFLVLWNVLRFYLTYSRIDGFDPAAVDLPVAERPALDRWISSRLGQLVERAWASYEGYSVHLFMREVLAFIDALSRWYLRRSRRRIWKSTDDADKKAAYKTLFECLHTVTRLLAPVVPFVTEKMYQELVRPLDPAAPVSVHLNDFPARDAFAVDPELLAAMDAVLALVEVGHAARNNARIKVRQPLAELRIEAADPQVAWRVEPLLAMVEDELNVKRIVFAPVSELAELEVRLDGKVAGPKYKRLLNPVKEALEALDPAAVAKAVRGGNPVALRVAGETIEIPPAELQVERRAAEGWAIAESPDFLVALSTELTEELEREGRIRDLVRLIQNLRKEIGLEVDDRIRVAYAAQPDLAADIEHFADYVSTEILALELVAGEGGMAGAHSLALGEQAIEISIEKA
jgi:isoleucyl-tRNA synthetase